MTQLNLKSYEARIQNAVSAEMNIQEKEMIENGGLVYVYVRGIASVRYDLGRVDMAIAMEIESIYKELDMMLLREEVSEDEVDYIKENL